MGRIQDKNKKKDKIEVPKHAPLEHIVFSFRYLTTNKQFNFEYFGKDSRNSSVAYSAFIDCMKKLCHISISEAKGIGKTSGSEDIPYKTLSKSMRQICDLVDIISKDSTITIFRFYQQNYRIICKKDLKHSNILHIIAFDFNYSAYNHGS